MLILYALTLFLSAALLFIVQPMFARLVLPLLGGSPAVWNTTQVFFQAALLAGYAYAYATTRWLTPRRQILLHGFLLLTPLLTLPIAIPKGWMPPTASNPMPWLLVLLAVSVGLPFFVVSTSGPLLQQWFTRTGHRAAVDPYFLYAASNLGSLLALLSYPAVIEPTLRLADQSRGWAVGYGLLVALIIGCGVFLWRASAGAGSLPTPSAPKVEENLTLKRRLRWLLLAFVPSSLMLSVTTYLSTDIAAVPLLWVIPLALYLLTFVLVFASKPPLPHWLMVRVLPFVILPLVVLLAAHLTQTTLLLISLHLLAFFVVAMVCHGEIARDRPTPRHLTQFYLWISLGGVLGGIFNALLAPVIFSGVWEYPLTLVLAGLLLPLPLAVEASGPALSLSKGRRPESRSSRPSARRGHPYPPHVEDPRQGAPMRTTTVRSARRQETGGRERRQRLLDWGLPLALLLVITAVVLILKVQDSPLDPTLLLAIFTVPALVCLSFVRRPLRFGLGIGAIVLASVIYVGGGGRLLYTGRSFFGVYRVIDFYAQGYHLFYHGATLHGLQSTDPARQKEPLGYFHTTGPLGQVFTALDEKLAGGKIAVIGLGAGSTACYARPSQSWTFYEIDPAVERIARDPRYFTYLQNCAPEANVVLGDGRLSLASAPTGEYDLIILDAYNSDALPVHLMTREALQLYLSRLAPEGVLAFNITNVHMNLEPVLAALAGDAGLVSRTQDEVYIDPAEGERGKINSKWLIIARTVADLGSLVDDPLWLPSRVRPEMRVWTDDFSSVLSVLVSP